MNKDFLFIMGKNTYDKNVINFINSINQLGINYKIKIQLFKYDIENNEELFELIKIYKYVFILNDFQNFNIENLLNIINNFDIDYIKNSKFIILEKYIEDINKIKILLEDFIPKFFILNFSKIDILLKDLINIIADVNIIDNTEEINILKEFYNLLNTNAIISKSDTNGIITYVNDNFCRISGYEKEELCGNSHNLVRHPDMNKDVFKKLWNTIKNEKNKWQGIIKNLAKDGSSYYVQSSISPVLNEEQKIIEYISIRNDITTLMSDKTQLLDNICSFDNPLLILITIEDFNIMEKFHDKILILKILEDIKSKLLFLLPPKMGFCRVYNLDNGLFGLLTQMCCEPIEIKTYLFDFYNKLDKLNLKIDNIEYDINFLVSYGYGREKLFENVILGIEVSRKSKNDLIFANEVVNELKRTTEENIKTIKMVKTAIENYKIISYFQPIINNKTMKIEKYESLVRLIDENEKIISPFFFLDTAKKGKYYTQITNIVLENSFKALELINTSISINLSIIDIEKPQIREKIFELLLKYKEHNNRIIFELLEDENIKDFKVIKDFIKKIKSLGVQIAIDDFGSGYSNFERLLEFSPDILKIDGSLIKNILNDKLSLNVVETIVLFAKKQHIKTVAEFVENKEIFELLKNIGIDFSQGYYFGKPEKLFEKEYYNENTVLLQN
jgi:PAS domain S-box-containing protein